MENANDKQLSFPQRNWLLLCIIVAILSPLVVHWVRAGARKHVYDQAIEVRDTGKNTNAAGSGTDTSNKVASPPTTGAPTPSSGAAAPAAGATGGAAAAPSGTSKTN